MTYTINPNAKNVWIRDNEDTMDLSPITDASSVYLENGRTLEQELGEGSMVSNVATVNNSMSKVIDGTLDGAYESGVMYGRSLVNVLDKKKLLIGQNTTLEDDGSITAIANGGYYNLYFSDNGTIKENSEYLLIYEVVENTLDVDFYVNGGYSTNGLYENFIVGGVIVPPSTTGYFVKKVQTRSKAECINNFKVLRTFINTGATVGRKIKYRVQLIEYQEGIENWDIPYFEGICDVKMPILRNVGKNLFDGVYSDHYLQGGEETVFRPANGDEKTRGFLVKCKPNTTYVVTRSFISNRFTIGGFPTPPKDNDYYVTYKVTQNTFTTDGTNIYVYVYVSNEAEEPKVLFEESQVATPYEDHKTNILRTTEEIVLREVGGVCDTYNPLTGEYTKRIGEFILDGSDNETWGNYEVKGDNVKFAYYPTFVAQGTYQFVECLCDKWKAGSQANETIQEQISLYNHMPNGTPQTEVRITVSPTRLQSVDVTGFRAWLSQNPLTVQYILAEPVTTIVEPSTIPFAYQNGHVILESGYEGQSLLPTLEYSTVVNKTGQIQSVAKTIVKQETQITELEKMLIQGIIEMDYNNTLLTLNLEIDEVM